METNSSTSFLSRQRLSSHEIFDPTTVIPFILTKLLGGGECCLCKGWNSIKGREILDEIK